MKILKRLISFFVIIIFSSGIFLNVANAGLLKKAVTIVAIKEIVPIVVKFYGKKAIASSKTKIIEYIANNPNNKRVILKYIEDQGKNLKMEKNASMFINEINNITPTLKQGIRLPKNGIWSGNKGDSKFFINKINGLSSKDGNLLRELQNKMPKGVKFENGYPNFKPYAEKTINVKGMKGDHKLDVDLTKKTIIDKKIDINGKTYEKQADIEKMVKDKNLIYHHEGEAGEEMSLLDKSIHENIRHDGSSSILRNKKCKLKFTLIGI